MEFTDMIVTFGIVLVFSTAFITFYGWGVNEYDLIDVINFEDYEVTANFTSFYEDSLDSTLEQGELTTDVSIGNWYTGAGIFLKNLLTIPKMSVLAGGLFSAGMLDLNISAGIIAIVMTVIGVIFLMSVINAFLRWKS